MAELVAKSPCDGVLPLEIGSVAAREEDLGVITALLPYRAQGAALSERLKAAHGMAFPSPNRATGKAGARAIWAGREQALLLGPAPDPGLADHAALSDQSDAWTAVRLEGEAAEAVLARLVPVDLRGSVFKRGHTVRSQVAHMAGSVTRVGERAFLILVFRSMAATLVHDLKTAMEAVAARG
ncbi:sarcosine oxidase subunit gamma [Antarcticimicrobium luteum]|uniref:Sarcosine oxidase subunit gamma n=1 Tax=Antarcticimicrobium luteum TaxID=2547397 RepID=A0A4R5VFU8_9RHOB|nr:sarcosine oxidase subunit gamma [Antarcticimicrobium luteum]TDK51595.1 sarcosine oxidase subunit gamma [Antarcticimicrobium luteum]